MKREEFKAGNRVWLNPVDDYDTGAIQWNVDCSSNWVNASLYIWDCRKKAVLSFDFYEKDAKKKADKINLLIKELEAMKKAMGEAYTFSQRFDPMEDTIGLAMTDE